MGREECPPNTTDLHEKHLRGSQEQTPLRWERRKTCSGNGCRTWGSKSAHQRQQNYMRSTWDDPWLRSYDSWLCSYDSWGKTRKQLCEQDAIVIAHAIAIIRAIVIVYATAIAYAIMTARAVALLTLLCLLCFAYLALLTLLCLLCFAYFALFALRTSLWLLCFKR